MDFARWVELEQDQAKWEATDDSERADWFRMLGEMWRAGGRRAGALWKAQIAADGIKQAGETAAHFAKLASEAKK